MMLRTLFFVILPFLFASCAQSTRHDSLAALPDDKKSVKKSDVVILGGSMAGITAASKISDFDQSIKVALVEKKEEMLTEPLVNLYISGGIDRKMVTDKYGEISKKHRFEIIKEDTPRIDDVNKKLYFDDIVLEYKVLVDARYKREEPEKTKELFLCNDYEKIEEIRKKLFSMQGKRVLIDTGNLEEGELYRAYELFLLLKESMQDHDISIYIKKSNDLKIAREANIPEKSMISEIDTDRFDIVIAYAGYKEGDGEIKYRENFFRQYNEGQYIAADVIKKLNGANFLPGIVSEDTYMIIDLQKFEGMEIHRLEKLDFTQVLAKIKKIKLEIIQ